MHTNNEEDKKVVTQAFIDGAKAAVVGGVAVGALAFGLPHVLPRLGVKSSIIVPTGVKTFLIGAGFIAPFIYVAEMEMMKARKRQKNIEM